MSAAESERITFPTAASLQSFSARPRPSRGDWERMLADEHARGLHTEICGCSTIHTDGSRDA